MEDDILLSELRLCELSTFKVVPVRQDGISGVQSDVSGVPW